MKVKNIVRKAVALSSGAALVGTTLMGALAYDLATYPAKYIVDGKFDGKIVVGEKAATSDVLGSIDIAASLQGASVSKVALPGKAGTTTFSGDSFRIETGADKLELREPVGSVVDTITEGDLSGLKSGRITTASGSTEYHQYIRLKDGTDLQNMGVNYVQDRNRVTNDFFVVDTGLPFLEWEIQFPEGLESKRDSGTAATKLRDIEDRTFNIMGTDFNIVAAEIGGTGSAFSMTLMGGSVPITLRQGETKTYSINGVDYDVTLVFVSDPNTGDASVKFSVNGELTQSMTAGDTDTLTGGVQIGVRDILVNPREGIATFYLGAQKIEITGDALQSNDWDDRVKINNQAVSRAEATVLGAFTDSTNTTFEITSIKYRVRMKADSGSTAYVPAGKGLRELMDKPESLISDSLDIKYAGLEKPETKQVLFKSSGYDRYDMTYTNIDGQTYTFPLLTNRNAVFKYGDDKYTLWTVEAPDATTVGNFQIKQDDYVVVSAGNSPDRSVTNVLQYTDYNNDQKQVSFEDVASGAKITSSVSGPTNGIGTGTFTSGSKTYTVWVQNVTALVPNITVDLNADGLANGGKVKFTTWGGLVIDPAYQVGPGATVGTDPTIYNQTEGNATKLWQYQDSLASNTGYVTFEGMVVAKNFDTQVSGKSFGEKFYWSITGAASAKVAMTAVSTSTYQGNINGSSEYNQFVISDSSGNTDHKWGMTDYGILLDQYTPSSSSNPGDLTLAVPKSQVFAQVYATMGTVKAETGSDSGTADKVNPIAVGLAILDKDASGMIGKENVIVVGGPCANTVALELLGSPAKCSEGFEAGKAMIRSWDKGGKVAILVAGYESTETLGASRVLADYKAYSLKGDNVEVVVTSLDSIQVKSATTTTP